MLYLRRPLLAALGLAAALTAPAAWADAVVKLNMFMATSVQTFSVEALKSFKLLDITVKPLGNTSETTGVFAMPISETTYGASKFTGLGTAPIAGGSIGSALSIERTTLPGEPELRITLANFRIDYHTRLVTADATIAGQATVTRMPIYTFNVARPMAQELNEVGMLSLDEKLDKLKMTPQAIALFITGLDLPDFVETIMKAMQYGTLVQTVILLPRLPAPVSDVPYVAH